MKYYRRKHELKSGVRTAKRNCRIVLNSIKRQRGEESISRGYSKLLSFIKLAK